MPPLSPILDRRCRQDLPWRWSSRLLTLILWGGTVGLLGSPILRVLPRLVLASIAGLPLVVLGQRNNGLLTLAPVDDPGRRTVAQAFGLAEADLFRARHARHCTVHHDDVGKIVALQLPEPPPALLPSDRDAHPVG